MGAGRVPFRGVPINDDPEALSAAGRHADAARAAAAAGNHARAAELWERIWEFGAAARAWQAAGDPGRALRAAIEAKDEPLVDEIGKALAATDDGARIALDVLARQRRHGQAAELAERLGEIDRAIDHYQRAHRDLDAARLLEGAGKDREAARVLERALDLVVGDERPEVHLRLGRILGRRGSHDAAARHLQEATRAPATDAIATEARRHLVVALAAMGLSDAARTTLLELRRVAPDTPADLPQFLRAARAATPAPAGEKEIVAGRYRLVALLGAGAAGRVFRAVDEISGKTVALKMFFAAGARGGAAYERFVRESRLAQTLRHPALIEVYDVSLDHGFLVMEYLPGGSLAQRLAAGDRLGGTQVRRLALELLGGLELAHHRGVVHRDVKPANIFLDTRGAAKLGDFGVAHLVDLGQTQTGGLIGSLAYMAPEQITGAPITIAADLYALGVTLFEVLTGRLPFLGPDFVAQHLGETPPAPSSVVNDIAPAWDSIIERLLRKSPTERHGSIAELRTELEELHLGDRSGPSVALPRPRRDSRPHSIAELAVDDPAMPTEIGRYQFETPLGQTPVSRLYRAVDRVLDRSVVIERFIEGSDADASIARVLVLARAGTPFVQRALSYDRATRTAVFEAPSGAPVGEETAAVRGTPELDAKDTLRLLKRLARAVTAIHEAGGVHGAIGPATVVIAETWIPTLLASGLPPPVAGTTTADDVRAVIDILALVSGRTADALPAWLLGPAGSDAAVVARVAAMPRHTGAEMYAWADEVEVVGLRSR
jgi:serine/threonine-protein kinase